MYRQQHLTGLILVAASAVLWSLGGTISRFLTVDYVWTSVFWRAYFATVFLIGFMILHEGPEKTVENFRSMGWPGLLVAVCFAGASTTFVIALSYTTVANILLMQAGVPLLAALMAFLVFGERVNRSTWLAIAAVLAGVVIMVSETLTGLQSPIGDSLALLIAVLFAVATVITRRFSNVKMTPAVTLGTFISLCVATIMGGAQIVSTADTLWLVAFGAVNLGLGLACFALGARLIPAAIAALVGTIEPILAPVWVWLVHSEVPSGRTVLGGAVVFAALLAHILVDMWRKASAKETADA
jgi:drug/metabolite transporter (DMT)-like permease